MSGKIGKYTYKNETVLNEFLGKLFNVLAKRKGSKVAKKLMQDPEMKRIMRNADKELQKIQQKRKNDPDLDMNLKALGL